MSVKWKNARNLPDMLRPIFGHTPRKFPSQARYSRVATSRIYAHQALIFYHKRPGKSIENRKFAVKFQTKFSRNFPSIFMYYAHTLSVPRRYSPPAPAVRSLFRRRAGIGVPARAFLLFSVTATLAPRKSHMDNAPIHMKKCFQSS